jgi:CheY-like chemotaxis protein
MTTSDTTKTAAQKGIEVKLWGIYPFKNRHRLYDILATYSLDGGPSENEFAEHDRISFKFLVYDWQKTIQKLLTDNNIPFVIHDYFTLEMPDYRRRQKIYIAEDDPDISMAMNILLKDAGYDVQLSSAGKPLMEDSRVAADLFILDKRMPDVDGIDVCRHLRAQDSTKETPVIMISATRDFAHQALSAGVDDCLEKPFQMHDLLNVVSKHANRKHSKNSNLQLL